MHESSPDIRARKRKTSKEKLEVLFSFRDLPPLKEVEFSRLIGVGQPSHRRHEARMQTVVLVSSGKPGIDAKSVIAA